MDKVITTPELFSTFQTNAKNRIINILLKREVGIEKNEFNILLGNLFYEGDLENKIKAKYNNIFSKNANLEENLNAILNSIDENVTPLSYLKTVLINNWLLADERLSYFQHLVAKAGFSWEDYEYLYEKKRNQPLRKNDIIEAVKQLDHEIAKLEQVNATLSSMDPEHKSTPDKIETINDLKIFIRSLITEEVDKTEKDFKSVVKETRLEWKDYQYLYEKKRDHLLTREDINRANEKLDSKIAESHSLIPKLKVLKKFIESLPSTEVNGQDFRNLVEAVNLKWEGGFQPLYAKKRDSLLAEQDKDLEKATKKINQEIDKIKSNNNKINNLKDNIKNLILLSETDFQELVEKAGYNYKENFQDLYQKITYKNTGEPPLGQLKDALIGSIKKLDSTFEELDNESLNPTRRNTLKLSAEYLIEEIGMVAGKLLIRKDYIEPAYLSTSKRNLDLISMCRKSCAHFPLGLDEKLIEYLMGQLVLDARLRLAPSQVNVEVPTKDLDFQKSRKITWDELERKKTEIYALVEGLGFKSDFKIFGKSLGCDIGVQGDLNLLIEAIEAPEINTEHQNLIELETGLSRELNCDVRAYTPTTLAGRLQLKVTSEHIQQIQESATHTLEDVILGNTFIQMFREDRWASFRTPDGNVFTRSDFLEQRDLIKIASFLLGSKFSWQQLESLLNDKETLQKTIQGRLCEYNASPKQYSQGLKDVLLILSSVVPLYETKFQFIYIPVRKRDGKIDYTYYLPFGKVGIEHYTIGGLPPKWNSDELKKINPSMQSLYSPQLQLDGSTVWIKCDEIFKESLIKIQKREKISELIGQEITDLLHNKRSGILKALFPSNRVTEEKIFTAVSVDYAYTQQELEKDREETRIFRKKRLEGDVKLQQIIRDKVAKYYGALEKQLSLLSPQVRKYVLQYILLDKEMDMLLKEVYEKTEENINFLWQVMDYKQKSAFNHISQHHDSKAIAPYIQEINNSFSFFKQKNKKNINNIKDKEVRYKMIETLEKQDLIIDNLIPELLKSQFPESWQQDIQVIPTIRRDMTYFGIGFNTPRFINHIKIPSSYFTGEEVPKLIDKYSFMFFPVGDPQVIKCFLEDKNPTEHLYLDFCNQYNNLVESSTAFTILDGTTKKSRNMVDFASEVEYINYERKKQTKKSLERLTDRNRGNSKRRKISSSERLRKPLRKLVNERKGQDLSYAQATLCGFSGEVSAIYSQIAGINSFAQRKLLTPKLLLEDLPEFISRNTSPHIELGLLSASHSKTIFANSVHDLSDLMHNYGWSEDSIALYKSKNNFKKDNQIIEEYYSFVRLSKSLSSAKLRETEYKKKVDDLKEKLEQHDKSYTPFQQKKLAAGAEIYRQALQKNLEYQMYLQKQILEHPHLERNISEALRDPDFLYDLHKNHQNLSNVEIQGLIDQKRELLKNKALMK